MRVETSTGSMGACEDFLNAFGVELVIKERSEATRQSMKLPRYYMSTTKMVEIAENGMLSTICASGNTPESTYKRYANMLTGRQLLIDNTHRINTPDKWRN